MKLKVHINTKRLRGNWVPRLIGRRVPKRTGRFQNPNMQKVTIDGVTYFASTSNIKTIKKLRESGMSSQQIAARFS